MGQLADPLRQTTKNFVKPLAPKRRGEYTGSEQTFGFEKGHERMKSREEVTRTVPDLLSEIMEILDTLPEKSLQTVYYFVRRLAYNLQQKPSS